MDKLQRQNGFNTVKFKKKKKKKKGYFVCQNTMYKNANNLSSFFFFFFNFLVILVTSLSFENDKVIKVMSSSHTKMKRMEVPMTSELARYVFGVHVKFENYMNNKQNTLKSEIMPVD